MNENFNRQFAIVDFKWIDNPAYLKFAASMKNAIMIYMLRRIYRSEKPHPFGLDQYYLKRQQLVCVIDQQELADELGVSRQIVGKHIKEMEKLGVLKSIRTGHGNIYVVGEWIDVSEEKDKSSKIEWFYLDRIFGIKNTPDDNEEDDSGAKKNEENSTHNEKGSKEKLADDKKSLHQMVTNQTSKSRSKKKFTSDGNKSLHPYIDNINKINNTNVNVDKKTASQKSKGRKSQLYKLPQLSLDPDQINAYAQEMASRLGDDGSLNFFRLVASRIPKAKYDQLLAEIKADGSAQKPAAVFTSAVEELAKEKLQKSKNQSQKDKLAEQKAAMLKAMSVSKSGQNQDSETSSYPRASG